MQQGGTLTISKDSSIEHWENSSAGIIYIHASFTGTLPDTSVGGSTIVVNPFADHKGEIYARNSTINIVQQGGSYTPATLAVGQWGGIY
jgi:hypothetical protein